MLNHPTHQIKINLPQPGETKAQFMTRSVRMLLKSGKSKDDAIQIAERIWNNVSQHVSIQPNQTDSNVVFSGNISNQQNRSVGGSVSVRQTDSFSHLKSKLDKAEFERQSQNQNQFLQNLQAVITKSLSPLAALSQQLGSNNINNFKNYNNINNFSNGSVAGGIPGNIQGILTQSVQIQGQMLQQLSAITQLLQTSLTELTTIRSTGLRVRQANAKSKQPNYSDYWKSETNNIQLHGVYGNFLETFISNIADEIPGLAKGLNVVRNIVNPVQYARKKVGSFVRGKIDSFRKYTGDLEYRYGNDREQLKKDSGLLVLNTEQLTNQVITKIVPDKLGEIIDADKEKIDLLRNIYRVNAQMANYLTKGQVNANFQSTINKERTVFDSDVGQYFTQSEYENFTKSRLNQIRRFLTNTKNNIQQDSIRRFFASANKTLNTFAKKTFGTTGNLSEQEILDAILAGYNPDSNPYALAHREEQYADRMYNVLNKNEIRSARKFGPQAFGGASFGKPIDFVRRTVLDEVQNGPVFAIVGTNSDGTPIIKQIRASDLTDEMKYMKRKNGSYITDKHGNAKLRWARHTRVGKDSVLDLRQNAKLSYDDLILGDGKESTYNPFLITKDLFKEFKSLLSPITDIIHDNIDDKSFAPLRLLKRLTPKIKDSDEKIYSASSLNLNPVQITKSKLSSIFDKKLSVGSLTNNMDTELEGSISDYKTFVINDKDHPLYVIDISKGLINNIPSEHIINNSIHGFMPNGNGLPINSINGTNTSVGKELELEQLERKQDKRDTVQEQLNSNIEQLNELLENGGITRSSSIVENANKNNDSIFKSLFGGGLISSLGTGLMAILGGLGITKLISGVIGGVTGLIKGSLGLLFSGLSKSFGSILEGFGKGLLGKVGLIAGGWAAVDYLNDKVFGITEHKEGQTTEKWQNENADSLGGMGVAATGMISGGQYLKNKLGPAEDLRLNDQYKANLEAAKSAKGSDLTSIEKSKIAKDTLKSNAKSIGKNVIRGVAKKLPIIGFLMSSYAALERVKAGDYTGALAQVGSGLLSTLPGVGTAASLLVDAGLAVRDHTAFSAENIKNVKIDGTEKSVNENNKKENINPKDLVIEQPNPNRIPGDYITVKVTASQWEDSYSEWISKFGEPTNRYKDGSVSYVIPMKQVGMIPNVANHVMNTHHSPHNPTLTDLHRISSNNPYGFTPDGTQANNLLYSEINNNGNNQLVKFHSGGLIEGNPGTEQPIMAKPGEYILNQNEIKTVSGHLEDISDSLHKMQVTDAYTFEKIQKPLSKTFIKELEEKGSLGEVLNESFYEPPKKNGLFDFFKSNDTKINNNASNNNSSEEFLGNIGPIVTQNSISAAMAEKEQALGRKDVKDLNIKHFKIGNKRIGAIEASRLNTQFYSPQQYNVVYGAQTMSADQVARRYGLTEDDLKKPDAYTLYYDPVGGNNNLANIPQTNVFQRISGNKGYTFKPTRGNSVPQLFNEITGNSSSEVSVPNSNGMLGSLSAKYESGGRGSAAIGWDRTGGTSYGKYQLSAKQGSYQEFINYASQQGPEGAAFAAKLKAAGSGETGSRNGAAPEVWREFAKQNPELLHKWEHGYIKSSSYDPIFKKLDPEIQQVVSQNPALQEVLWSSAVQHKNYTPGIFKKAWAKSNGDPETFISEIYKERGTRFPSSTPEVRASVQRRFVNEAKQALAMQRQNQKNNIEQTGIENLHTELNNTQKAINEQNKQLQNQQTQTSIVNSKTNPASIQNVSTANNNVVNNGAFSVPSAPNSTTGAAAQQSGVRTLDGSTQHVINSLFDNTSTNFSQGATNYAIGNNPMSVTHI